MQNETKAKNLYWSERGAICCKEHAPYRGSDTWRWERWRKMKPAEKRAFAAEIGQEPQCEALPCR